MKYSIALTLGVALFLSCKEQNKTLEIAEVIPTEKEVAKAPLQINNPIIKDKFTADPAALVHDGTVYLYAGHDEAPNDFHFYRMNEWLVYSSTNMVDWQEHPVPLKPSDFKWAKGDAWAAQVIERNGKFYWYVTVEHDDTHPGKAVGVAVADSPIGPFKDALGKALVTNDMTTHSDISWDDIDPSVIIDDDGQAYLFWGNTVCKYAKLKENMVELDGPIHVIDVPKFTEAPWIHKKGDWYYLSYASEFPEKIVYAMSKSVTGPWEYKGILNELAGNCNTNHQAIIEYKGKDYFIYHTGGINPNGGSFRRSVCIDELNYNQDGTLQRVVMTSEGIQK
ncbi:glycoside hydrolase family 43 protein [Mangrovimonas sp. DI 80]|uniref:glycoside hydrolase family 43 protein n=1 Tax=Mangrovimonas sp. DI 80 TaxID=1779330 RepID=UPI0009F8FA96|nr:glycoside hydrolase family 43 protein [Mangrovimonas sp. DI 80]